MSQDNQKPQSAAERMRDYRLRRRYGLRCVQVQVGRAEVDGLVANGYLRPDKASDLHAIGLAVSDLMFDWLERP